MPDDRQAWIRHFFFLALLTALVHLLQAVASFALWAQVGSPVLLAFGLDALVNASRELILGVRIGRYNTADVAGNPDRGVFRLAGACYVLTGLIAVGVGISGLWSRERPLATLLGVGLAAVSMLLIPIIGSYMKALAMELKSPALKAASVFTFGNSYLSMVLLISLLINSGMDIWWGDALGAIVIAPFIIQKGIQILLDTAAPEFVEVATGDE